MMSVFLVYARRGLESAISTHVKPKEVRLVRFHDLRSAYPEGLTGSGRDLVLTRLDPIFSTPRDRRMLRVCKQASRTGLHNQSSKLQLNTKEAGTAIPAEGSEPIESAAVAPITNLCILTGRKWPYPQRGSRRVVESGKRSAGSAPGESFRVKVVSGGENEGIEGVLLGHSSVFAFCSSQVCVLSDWQAI